MGISPGFAIPLFVAVIASFATGGCSNMAPSDRAIVIFANAHDFGSTAVAFTPDGNHVVSGGHRGDVKVWDVRRQKLLTEVKLHEGAVRAIAVASPSMFATAADDGEVTIWNNGRILSQATSTLVTSLVWFRGKLVSGHNDRFLRVWDKNLMEITKIKMDGGIEGLAARGKRLAVAFTGRITLMGPDFAVINELDTGGTTPRDIQFSPDGERIAAGGWFRLHLWDVHTGQHQRIATEHGGLLTSVSFSPDGKHIVTLGRHSDSAIRIMETETFSVERRYQAHELCGAMIRYSPDGRWLASASDDESIRLYDLARPYQPRTGHEKISLQPITQSP
jgi:WD40 repeat protein